LGEPAANQPTNQPTSQRASRCFRETPATMNTALKTRLAFLASAIALLCAPALRAQTQSFLVDINTSTLNTQDSANAPFYLDFQLNYGNSANASSTVTLSSFTLTGGSAVGSPLTFGSATGSLNSLVTLTASSTAGQNGSNELYQQFGSGVTDIKFTATVFEPGPNIGTPSEFVTGVFDSALGAAGPLNTTAPDGQNLLTLNLDASNTFANVNTYTSLSSADGTTVTGVTASATIPEPTTTAAMLGGVVVVFALGARRFGQQRKFQGQSSLALEG
jgi:hypothetical protein